MWGQRTAAWQLWWWGIVLAAALGEAAATQAEPTTHMIPMRDGTKLATSVYLPTGKGPWPVVLARSPYSRNSPAGGVIAMQATQKGYAFALQDVRVMGDSEGKPTIVFRADGWGQRQDGYDTVEWIAEQEWCDGQVGTWGMSALGVTQNMMAPSHPPHLVCQHVAVAFADMYSQCVYQGGAWRRELIEAWLEVNKIVEPNVSAFVAHPRYDDFWRGFDLTSCPEQVNAPAMYVGGWYDCFCQGTIDAFVAVQARGGPKARGKCKLILGPWAHGAMKELKYPANSALPKESDAWRWLDHCLKGKDNGLAGQAAVHYYVMGDPEDKNAPGNEWRTADSWPVPSVPTPLYLHQDGKLTREKPTMAGSARSYDYDAKNPVPTVGGLNLTGGVGPADQLSVESRPDVLVFTSEALTEPLEVTGRIKVKLWISSSAADTDWTAKLCDVYPDGRSMLVTDGLIRARYRESFEREVLLEPGRVYPVEIDLWSTSLILDRGHRLRVAISSSNSPRFEPNPNTAAAFRTDNQTVIAHNTVYLDRDRHSHILLPVVTSSPVSSTKPEK